MAHEGADGPYLWSHHGSALPLSDSKFTDLRQMQAPERLAVASMRGSLRLCRVGFPPFPGLDRVRLYPKSLRSTTGRHLEFGQKVIVRDLRCYPGVPHSHQFLVQVYPSGQRHLREGAPVGVQSKGVDGDRLIEGQCAGKAAGFSTVGLPQFGAVDIAEAKSDLFPFMLDVDRIAVDDRGHEGLVGLSLG